MDDRVDAVFFALSDGTRRQVLECISERGPASASELAEDLPVTRQAVAKHLSALAEAGLVAPEQAGRHRRYRITPAPMGEAVSYMARLGGEWDERLDALKRLLGDTH